MPNAQSFGGAYRGRVCVYVFIGVSVCKKTLPAMPHPQEAIGVHLLRVGGRFFFAKIC
jgi:hypothetical protein